MTTSIAYAAADVGSLLGIPCLRKGPVPEPQEGEIVVYCGGWDLLTLRNSRAGREFMEQDPWIDILRWRAKIGYYRLLLPVASTMDMPLPRQLVHLRSLEELWRPAPVIPVVTALLVHLMITGENLLEGRLCRCSEALIHGYRVAVASDSGLLCVNGCDDRQTSNVCLAAARTV